MRFGFTFKLGGTHTSRTMMLEDLRTLLSYIDDPNALQIEYRQAICEQNSLGKRSGRTRLLSYRHLVDLYALDPACMLFRSLRFFWLRDPQGQPLLALLCAYARDSILRTTRPFLLNVPEGKIIKRSDLEEFILNQLPDRFSNTTLKSTAQNINATWTKSGHINGRSRKIRSRAVATPGSVSFALLLGYLTGVRGEALFQTEYVALLDCTFEVAAEMAQDASRRGWIIFKRVGTVIEVLFPNLVTDQEMEWIREQG
jgi:hypothetical protein